MIREPTALCLLIHESFQNSHYPGDSHIVIDNTGLEPECEKIRNVLQGSIWTEVSFEKLGKLKTSLPFLSPEGYRYYIPAFMVFSIVDFAQAGVIPDEVIRSLTAPNVTDVQRIRRLATQRPLLQPLAAAELERTLETIAIAHDTGALKNVFQTRMAGFELAQRKSIREFLEFMRDWYGDEFPSREPDTALKRYWSRFWSDQEVD